MDDETLRAAVAACESEPIHVPGAILPHGAMLVCDAATLELRYYSANFAQLTQYAGEMFPGMAVAEIIGRQAVHDLRNAMATTGAAAKVPTGMVPGLRLPWSEAVFDVAMHRHAGAMLIEFEPAPEQGSGAGHALDMTRQLVGRLAAAKDSRRLFDMGARLSQALLGFDRVMVYRFMPDGAGKVVAEARAPGMDSFMGHHFPPGDIPPQARALYLANPIRSIPDSAYAPVPLQPALAPGAAPVDMSHAQLRSVSPVHCEYLRNMGVGASLSISIIVDGELWGLIACHNKAPKPVPSSSRVSAELFGHYFALQIAATERREAMRMRSETRAQLDQLMAGMVGEDDLAHSLTGRLSRIAALMGCQGAAFWRGGVWSATPLALSQADGLRLLATAGAGRIWYSQQIGADIAGLSPPAGIAGALVIPLSDSRADAFFLFRRSEAHGVDWAGEPAKQIAEIAGRITLSPRSSFALWREEVEGRSVPWSEDDLAIAEALRSWLRDAVLIETEANAREREEVGRRRSLVNEELNHRIRNVLSLVKSIALQTGASASTVGEYAELLEGRLQALASAHDQSLEEGAGSLAKLIDVEAALHRSKALPDRVRAEGPDLVLSDKTYGVLALALHEMMTNAAKYGSLSVPEGRLSLLWSFDEATGLMLDWRERGGPTVAPPRRTGFGSRLIRNSVEHDLKGRTEIDFDPDGLVARIVIPACHVALAEQPARAREGEVGHGVSLHGLSVLLVEDQSLIAMDTEATLRQLGASDIRLAANVRDALTILANFSPDLSVLDFNLGEETSEAVALSLIDRKSPFIFTTGYSDQASLGIAFRNVPVIRKPINSMAIAVNVAAARSAVQG